MPDQSRSDARAAGEILDRRVLLGAGALAGSALASPSSAAPIEPTALLVLPDRREASRSAFSAPSVNQILVLRYDSATPNCPVVYQRAMTEPAHSAKLQAADGSWWEITDRSVSLFAFGARGDQQDDTVAIENALSYLVSRGGGELVIPPGLFAYTRDIRLMASGVQIRGAGSTSILHGKNNARLILGHATPEAGDRAGTRVIGISLSSFSVAPAANHAGECILVDYADNTVFCDINVGPWNQDGRTVTHGIKTNWVQYTQWRNVQINVNGYGIYIYLPKGSWENEDHFSIYSSWLYCGKTRNPDCRPACIAIEREAGRRAPIFQFSVYSTHLGCFMADADSARNFTAGLLAINPAPGTRILHAGHFTSCMFEYVGRGIDLVSRAARDGSRLVLESCAFLQQDICYDGAPYSAIITSIGNYYLQCKLLVDGPHILFEGHNIQEQMGAVSVQPLSYHRFAHKTGGVPSLSGVELARGSNQAVAAGQSSVKISFNLSAKPDRIHIIPGWDTSSWVSEISAQSLLVHFGSPPKQQSNLFWDVEVGDN